MMQRLAALLTPKSLFLFVNGKPFHLKHYVTGLGRTVAIGSGHPVGAQGLPDTLGRLKLRSATGTFTPVVAGVYVNDVGQKVGEPRSIRHLTRITWKDATITFEIVTHLELLVLTAQCGCQ
jgi:hypothetical protein